MCVCVLLGCSVAKGNMVFFKWAMIISLLKFNDNTIFSLSFTLMNILNHFDAVGQAHFYPLTIPSKKNDY